MITIDKLKEFGANTAEGLERCCGMEALYLKLVKMVPDEKNFGLLKNALDENDLDTAFQAAHALKGVLGRSILLTASVIASDPEFNGAVERLFRRCGDGVAQNAPGIVGALYELFGALSEKRAEAVLDTPSARFGQKAEQLKPALEYIETHYSQPITLSALARLTGMSPKYFCRFFRTIVHRSPIDYVNYYRVECASHFLSSGDMTVAEIAQHCGYNDSSFFIKQFRKYKGVTPKQYRKIG